MTPLWRMFIALTFALLGMQGASACEHGPASAGVVSAHASPTAASRHGDEALRSMDMRGPISRCHRTHSPCCTTMCGAHCGALLPTTGSSVPAQPVRLQPSRSEPLRAGITRAPPVRPPIV